MKGVIQKVQSQTEAEALISRESFPDTSDSEKPKFRKSVW